MDVPSNCKLEIIIEYTLLEDYNLYNLKSYLILYESALPGGK